MKIIAGANVEGALENRQLPLYIGPNGNIAASLVDTAGLGQESKRKLLQAII